MADKSMITMYVGLGLMVLAAIGLILYFFVFRKKKDDDDKDTPGSREIDNTGTTFGAPSGGGGDTSGGASSRDVDILDNMGNAANTLTLSALSLRRQRKSWTGPIVILEKDYAGGETRSAAFSATADGTRLVNGDGDGLDAWIGARLVFWYDQSGNNMHATPRDTNAILRRTQPRAGIPSYYAFDMSKGSLHLGNDQNVPNFNQISIYSDSAPKLNGVDLVNFGSTPVNTVFVLSSDIDSNYKNFLMEDRNPPLKLIPK